ncbi:MAG TPA: histidine kinase dimerization/phospho-acceptor domain-containing protein, partial [Nitrososphaera sp.]|nr:histidine kinase dimerization/phospho-acceptor domain-containing protein [Nitrososphaera sp.]
METSRDKTVKRKVNPMVFIVSIILVSYALFFYFQIGFEYNMKENVLHSSYEQQVSDSSEIAMALQSRLNFILSILRDAGSNEVVPSDSTSTASFLEGVTASLDVPNSVAFLLVDSRIVDLRGTSSGIAQESWEADVAATHLLVNDSDNPSAAISSLVMDGETFMTVAYPLKDEGTYLVVAFPTSEIRSAAAPEAYSAYLSDVNLNQIILLSESMDESEFSEGIPDSFVAALSSTLTAEPEEARNPLIYDSDLGERMITGSYIKIMETEYAVFITSSVEQQLMGIGETLFAQRIQTFSLLAGTSLITIILALFLSKNLRLDREVKARTGELEQSNLLIGKQKQELELANRQLKQVDVLKDQFISVASHELKNPIQPILMYTELAKRGNVSPEKALDGIAVEAKRLKKLANDILDVSMIESGGLKYNIEKVRLKGLVDDVASSAQVSAPEGVKVEVL